MLTHMSIHICMLRIFLLWSKPNGSMGKSCALKHDDLSDTWYPRGRAKTEPAHASCPLTSTYEPHWLTQNDRQTDRQRDGGREGWKKSKKGEKCNKN